jgi:hypothetical protein
MTVKRTGDAAAGVLRSSSRSSLGCSTRDRSFGPVSPGAELADPPGSAKWPDAGLMLVESGDGPALVGVDEHGWATQVVRDI